MAPAFVLALAVALGVPPIWPVWLTILMLVVFAALVHLVSRRDADVSPLTTPDLEEQVPSRQVSVAKRAALPIILLFVLARGYAGPALHDWPFIRGVDHYSHAVMANLMMTQGEISPYLIYPPGFHAMTAIISRLSGLRPLEVFPVLAPVLLLLPVLALYSMARRLWGQEYGLAAALLAATLGGAYVYFNDAMYPNLVAAQFLLVLTVAALFRLLAAPTWRHAVLLAFLGSSVVLFHQVTSLYLVLLFAPVGLFALPYLLRRERATGVVLSASFALMGVLAAAYAWNTYDLGVLFDGKESATGDAVGMAIGTQMPNAYYTLLLEIVTQPVAWLGVLGLFLALEGLRGGTVETSSRTPRVLAHLLLLFWVAVLFVGSRTDLSGFPRRFGRDLGVPLTLFAALALVVILRSVLGERRRSPWPRCSPSLPSGSSELR